MTPADDFEQLFHGAPFGYVTTRPDGTIHLVNDTLLAWLGRDRDAVAGTAFSALLDAGSRLFWETRHQPVLLLSGEVREVALTLLRADGEPLSVLSNSVVVDAAGEPQGLRIALLDTTQRYDYERTLLEAMRAAERSGARLQVLQASGATLIAATSQDEVIESLVLSALTAFDASTVTVFLADDAGALRAAGGTDRAPDPVGPVQEAFDAAAPVAIGSLDEAKSRYPQLIGTMRAGRVEAFLAVPMVAAAEPIGVLLVTYARARPIEGAVIELQVALALQATQALARLMLQARLERMALHDPLTGLANRQLLHDRLEQELARVTRTGHPLGVLFFDIDGFKQVNDALGHTVGDEVLVEVAARVPAAVRAGDFCARFGGDEFVVLCTDADLDAVVAVAERVRSAIAQPLATIASRVTASIGVAVVNSDAAIVGADVVLARADQAMYRSKQAGRDRVTAEVVR